MRNQPSRRALVVTFWALLLAFAGCSDPQPAADDRRDAAGVDAEFAVETFAATLPPTLEILNPTEYKYFYVDYTANPLVAVKVNLQFKVSNYTIGSGAGQVICRVDYKNPALTTTTLGIANVDLGTTKGTRVITCNLASATGQIEPNAEAFVARHVYISQDPFDSSVANGCANSLECNDGVACTLDDCVGGKCEFKYKAYCCGNDLECAPNLNCLGIGTYDAKCSACLSNADCDDGDPCTNNVCDTSDFVGKCSFPKPDPECCTQPTDACDDGKACTLDSCDVAAKKCKHAKIPDTCCTDSDCAAPDICSVAACVDAECRFAKDQFKPGCCQTDVDCDIGNFCTISKCSATAGPNGYKTCDWSLDPAKIVDSKKCCEMKGTTNECNDGNPCTYDICTNYQCVNKEVAQCCKVNGDCEDDNFCTTNTCVKAVGDDVGQCQYPKPDPSCCLANGDCNDGKFCTTELCDTNQFKCVVTNTATDCCDTDAECDDGKFCSADSCVNHYCLHGPDKFKAPCCETGNAECNDGNPCTLDTCDLATKKCSSKSNGDPLCCVDSVGCDDGDCTTIDYCGADNKCTTKTNPESCKVNLDCDDGNSCTKDSCDTTNPSCGVCKHDVEPTCCTQDFQCDDSVALNGQPPNPKAVCTTDKCVNNQCVNTTIANCCATDTDAKTTCDDKNGCTIDYCLANSCHHTLPKGGCCASNADCNDGSQCTTDACANIDATSKMGSCTHVQQPGCICTKEGAQLGIECNDNNLCTADSCIGGLCNNAPIAGCCLDKFDCDDGAPCTYDYCMLNECVHPPTSSGQKLCCSKETEALDCAFLNTECAQGVCADQPDGAKSCVTQSLPVCTVNIGYCQDFQSGSDLNAMGWNPGDLAASKAAKNWKVATDTGLGPDKHAKLDWTPTVVNYDTCLQSPVIQAAGAKTITIQYDHEFAPNIGTATISIYGSLGGANPDWSQGTLVQTWLDQAAILGPQTVDIKLPSGLTGSNGLRLAFCVQGASTFDISSYALDNICIVKGEKPAMTKCPVNQIVPMGTSKTLPVKAKDPDLDAILSFQLVNAPSFVSLSSALYYWLDESWNTNLTISPGSVADVGTWPVTIKVSDGTLYSLCTFEITVTYQGGFLVWRPSEVPKIHGDKLFTALKAQGVTVQHITDLSLYPQLKGFQGIFVALGVYPNNHVLDETESTALLGYAAETGKLYMEGGDTWAFDKQWPIHSAFKLLPKNDSSTTGITGPLAGSGMYKDIAQSPAKVYKFGFEAGNLDYDNLNDVIAGKTNIARTKTVLVSDGSEISGVQVGHDDPQGYRTVASSIPFAGVVEGPTGDTPNQMMARILHFFANGFVDCLTNDQCDDQDTCTIDSCTGGACVNKSNCTCSSGGGLTCGASATLVSNGAGSTTNVKTYGCDPSVDYTGKEFALKYSAVNSAPVTVKVSNLTNPAARVFVLKGNQGACDAKQCIAMGAATTFNFAGAAGNDYFIVIDVPAGGTAQADVQISCGQPEICNDGVDNNGNNLVDCKDLGSCCGDAACAEVCDGADNNCDGSVDEGCDDDADGYCDKDMTVAGTPAICPKGGGDCDDTGGTTNPGAVEVCNNGKDDNCDGTGNEEGSQGCGNYWVDVDGDTYGAGAGKCLCSPIGAYKAIKSGDCKDDNDKVNPAAVEICGNGLDDNCSGSQNDTNALGCSDFFTDADQDTWGSLPKKCQCIAQGAISATKPGDCKDNNALVNPDSAESCNDQDDNCNGATDEGCDDDKDGYCDTGLGYESIGGSTKLCGSAPQLQNLVLTCAPGSTITVIDFASYGDAGGVCQLFQTGACNAAASLQVVKTACLGKSSCSIPATNAAFGGDPCAGTAKSLTVQVTCTGSTGTAPQICPKGAGDTDDKDPLVNPEGKEICDNIDNDSDGLIDDGCDDDNDDFCDKSMIVVGAPGVCPKGTGDCDDDQNKVNPGMAEDCNTPADDDCNGNTNDLNANNCQPYFIDGDSDGYGNKQFKCFCSPVGVYKAKKTADCDDTLASINPGAIEVCDNFDNNCSGTVDEGCDDDGDGYCDLAQGMGSAGSVLCVNGGGDCDDTNSGVNPGKAEICGNNIDDNCAGGQNDAGAIGCTNYYGDGDGDGFGSQASKCLCSATGAFTSDNSLDCNDNDKAVKPGAIEICDNLDNNCSDNPAVAEKNTFGAASQAVAANYIAQEVVFATGGTLSSIGVRLKAVSSQSATLYLYKGAKPSALTGQVEAIGPLAIAASGTTFVDYKFTSAVKPTVTAGETWVLVLKSSGADASLNATAANAYTKGGAFSAPSSPFTWTALGSGATDIGFEIALIPAGSPVDEGCDDDNDGFCDANMKTTAADTCTSGGGDCVDTNAQINPAVAKELCDGKDDNCNGLTDDGCDDDADGYCDAGYTIANPAPAICSKGTGDCDDLNSDQNPGAKEVCSNSIDDNCNGSQNDADAIGCKPYYYDGDNDGAGVNINKCMCASSGLFTAAAGGDCDDANTQVKPGAAEVCADGVDNDCDGDDNDPGASGCKDFFVDGDNDGYGLAGLKQCLCLGSAPYKASKSGDCNDNSAVINPGKTEVCNDADDNCTAGVDEGCNDDFDGYCDSAMTTVGLPNICPFGGGDCVDTNASANPGKPEQCDDVDNNCNDAKDEGCNDDADNYCDAAMVTVGKPTICNAGGGDCDDSKNGVFPNNGEFCTTTWDDNCNGDTNDPGAQGCTAYGLDNDGDAYGDKSAAGACTCKAIQPYTGTKGNTDCNDKNDLVNPGIAELCDGIDNNCVGGTDEGCDDDKDGFCDSTMITVGKPTVCIKGGGDCQDNNPVVNPAAIETCANGVDEDCDGSLNGMNATGCTVYYLDADKDSWGVNVGQCWCSPTNGYTVGASKLGDCDDTTSAVNPGATEVCGDGKDNNCNGSQNDVNATGCLGFYKDGDKDGYGAGATQCQCFAEGLFITAQGNDCDDGNNAVNPGVLERCDELDNQCNSQIDEGCDDDNDDYCDAAMFTSGTPSVCPFGKGDCNDGSSAIKPGAAEVCDNLDQNCDSTIDDGCDDDKDGYCDKSLTVVGTPTICISGGNDCDDTNSQVRPGKTELCDDLDNQCNGQIDEGCDDDNDNYCDSGLAVVGGPSTCTAGGGDCNDASNAVNPGKSEVCDGIDNNCAAGADETCKDSDGDGYCVGVSNVSTGCPKGGGDCNDSNKLVNPGALETCATEYDDNCDGENNVVTSGVGACTECGTGSDGDYAPTTSGTLAGGTYNYKSFTIKAGVTITVTGTAPLVIKVQGPITIAGELVANGLAGTNTTGTYDGASYPGGQGVAGGGKGGDACYGCTGGTGAGPGGGGGSSTSSYGGGGGGGGYATNGSNGQQSANGVYGTGGASHGDPQIGSFVGGSGGGGGGYGGAINQSGSGGGGGGGAIKLTGTAVTVSGAIRSNGGKGGDIVACGDGGAGGGGSGGTIWLRGSKMTITGTVQAVGGAAGLKCPSRPTGDGGAGAVGRIRVDSIDTIQGTTTPTLAKGDTTGLGDASMCTNFYVDGDGDGFGTGTPSCQCYQSGGKNVLQAGDCNDANKAVNPAAAEVCDGADNDCKDGTDTGCDKDGDLYCDSAKIIASTATCSKSKLPAPGSTGTGDDCDDANVKVFPGVAEICDGLDNNCNLVVDDGCDDDDDNYCDASMTTVDSSKPQLGVFIGTSINMDTRSHGGGYSPTHKEYWYPEWAGNTIYRYDLNYQLLGTFSSGTGSIMQLYGDVDDTYYTATWGNATIEKYQGKTANKLWSFNIGSTAGAVACDSQYVYAMRESGMTVWVLNKSNGSLVKTINLNGGTNTTTYGGLAVVGEFLYLGRYNGEVIRYNKTTGQYIDQFGVATNIYNMAFNGKDYCISANSSTVYCYTIQQNGLPPTCTAGGTDCNDGDTLINPKAKESCATPGDDNCDGKTDELGAQSCTTWYLDGDGDGFGSPSSQCWCAANGSYKSTKAGDCDDNDAQLYPGLAEACDFKDNNCNNAIDEGCDDDNDGYCDASMVYNGAPVPTVGKYKGSIVNMETYSHGGGYNPKYNEYWYPQWAGTTIYRFNSNYVYLGAFNSGQPQMMQVWGDTDGTYYTANWGYNTITKKASGYSASTLWSFNIGSTAGAVACDDTYVYAMRSDGMQVWVLNKSNGSQVKVINLNGGTNTSIYGGLAVIGDFLYVGRTNAEVFRYKKTDGTLVDQFNVATNIYNMAFNGKEYCISANSSQVYCYTVFGSVCPKGGNDCDDTTSNLSPAQAESCDGQDNNCSGATDEGCNKDGDAYCDATMPVVGTPAICPAGGGDCNDTDKVINPANTEVCDGKDNNCNNKVDDPGSSGCTPFFFDGDNDGYGVGSSLCLCAAEGAYSAKNSLDCNDKCATCKPGGGAELCDGVDNNCNNTVDELCNKDGDSYCDAALITVGTPLSCPKGGGDCNDKSKLISPEGIETCNNADENCNGIIDEGSGDACVAAPNTYFTCQAGQCVLKSCMAGYSNLNGSLSDGCECQSGDIYEPNNSCGSAYVINSNLQDTGTNGTGGQKDTIAGRIVETVDEDWYAIYAKDVADNGYGVCDQFNMRVTFLNNPGGNLRFDVWKGQCPAGGNNSVCCARTDFNWFTNFKAADGYYSDLWSEYGECPCASGNSFDQSNYGWNYSPSWGGPYCRDFNAAGVCYPQGHDFTRCADDSSWFYVRVYKVSGAPSCVDYKLEVSNGVYGNPGTGAGRKNW